MYDQYEDNQQYLNNQQYPKTPEEIKEAINKALVRNEILGYLNNNLLYMQIFGKNNSLDKIFMGIGAAAILLLSQMRRINAMGAAIVLALGIGFLIIGFILKKILKYYLIYDTERESFYTITNIFNNTVKKTKEIFRDDIIELGVNVTFKDDNNDRPDYNAINFKGDLMNNPGIRSSFVALLSNGRIVNISDPDGLAKPHNLAVARCKLFSECFGVNAVICDKKEMLKVVKEGINNFKLEKTSLIEELEKAKKKQNTVLIIVLAVCLLVPLAIFLLFVLSNN